MATMKAEEQKPQKEESNPDIKSQNKKSSESISPDSTPSDLKPESLPSSSSNTAPSYPSFSKLLEGVVMAANSALSSAPSVKTVGSEGELGMSHQEALANVTAKAAQGNPQMQVQTESAKSLITPLPKNKVEEDEIRKGDSSCNPNKPPDDVPRTPKSDGYGWRKYGQKQVKSSGSSRSYYRCTYISCCAKKKVQHLDISGEVIDVVYEGDHNHAPPQILKGSNRKKDSTSRTLNNSSDSSVQNIDAPHLITCDKEVKHLVPSAHECQDRNLNTAAGTPPRDVEERDSKTLVTISRFENELAIVPVVAEHGGSRSDNSDERAMIDPMKELDVAPLKKRRLKGRGKAGSESVYRTFKEPKIVVHAVGDVGLPSDGYRWRKYGQKMVKGTPHPRSYYRCSSTGCPARKHVERATDDSTAILVTYEGKHDHDVPVLKRHNHVASPNATASGANMASDNSENKLSAPEPSKDLDSDPVEEKASESGGDKVLESARTLLSIGIELKSC